MLTITILFIHMYLLFLNNNTSFSGYIRTHISIIEMLNYNVQFVEQV